jgi:CubicO group peptidase (beta-lactamase class C family)
VSTPGQVFNYNTAETNLVGTLLRSAIGNNLSTYLSEKIWQPFGMQHDAYWVLSDPGGGEFGGSSLNATLRDYARIGLFALRNGELRNCQRILPDGWMDESIAPSKGYGGYGYLWWLRGDGAYAARGIFGQGIYVNPVENVVIALHSARADASIEGDRTLQAALYKALTDVLK